MEGTTLKTITHPTAGEIAAAQPPPAETTSLTTTRATTYGVGEYVKLRLNPDYTLFANVKDNFWVESPLKDRNIELTNTSFLRFFCTTANPSRIPFAVQFSALSAFAFSHIPSIPYGWQLTLRAVSAASQVFAPMAFIASEYESNDAMNWTGGTCFAVGVVLFFVLIGDITSNWDAALDYLFSYPAFATFFTCNFCNIPPGTKYDTSLRFATYEVDHAMKRLPQLRDDPRLPLKDEKGTPITLPAYILIPKEGGAPEKKFYQLSKLLDLMYKGKISKETKAYFDITYFKKVLSVLQNPHLDIEKPKDKPRAINDDDDTEADDVPLV